MNIQSKSTELRKLHNDLQNKKITAAAYKQRKDAILSSDYCYHQNGGTTCSKELAGLNQLVLDGYLTKKEFITQEQLLSKYFLFFMMEAKHPSRICCK